jgi:hypothetical protein
MRAMAFPTSPRRPDEDETAFRERQNAIAVARGVERQRLRQAFKPAFLG